MRSSIHDFLTSAFLLVAVAAANAEASQAILFSLPQSPASSGNFVNGLGGFELARTVDLVVSSLGLTQKDVTSPICFLLAQVPFRVRAGDVNGVYINARS